MVAIEAKYYPATNTKGARIRVKAGDRKARFYSAYAGPGDEANGAYRSAVRDYNKAMNWQGEMIEGGTENGFVYVFAEGERI